MGSRVKAQLGAVIAVVAVCLGVVFAVRTGFSEFEPSSLLVVRPADVKAAQTGDAASNNAATQGGGMASPRVPVEAEIEESGPFRDWDALYNTSDYHFFVQSAAPAAIGGDGRAAWLISQALLQCGPFVLSNAGADPSAKRSLAEPPGDLSRTERCEGFQRSHPLDEFDLPEEAQRVDYWRAIAAAVGDGRAVMYRAVSVAAGVSSEMDAAARAHRYSSILDDVRVAVASKDPEAISTIGWMLMNPSVAREPVHEGIPWLLAACELGLDACWQARQGSCGQRSDCDPGVLLLEQVQREDSQTFAKLYATGQDIAYMVRVGDWDGLQPYLAMKPE
jgi:hypothetical protein